MEDSANSLNAKASNLISRNRPVALIANSSTFLGSHLVEVLLSKGIQVLALDDLTVLNKKKVEDHIKNKDFHLLNLPVDNDETVVKIIDLKLERLDYGFFVTEREVPDIVIGKGIVNFIELVRQIRDSLQNDQEKSHSDRPRLVLTSSINLYGKEFTQRERILKEAEVKFAKGIKHYKLNGRVLRLAEIFGPGMDLHGQSPLASLIEAFLNKNLEKLPVGLDFSERSLYIDDAVSLLIKSVLSGSTSNKIYDGALLHPLKLSEIKQLLLDPDWLNKQSANLTKLPDWPTPNLSKTIKELSWAPHTSTLKALKETVAYFKDHDSEIPAKEEQKKPHFAPDKSWSFAGSGFLEDDTPKSSPSDKKPAQIKDFDKEFKTFKKTTFTGKTKRAIGLIIVTSLLLYGLVWPFVYAGLEAFSIRNNLALAKDSLEVGDFQKSQDSIQKARNSVESLSNIVKGAKILAKIPVVNEHYAKTGQILDLAKEGIDGVYYATQGSKSLFETTKVISGESNEDPRTFYANAQRDLDFASAKLSKVYAGLAEPNLKQGMPVLISERIDDLRGRVDFYLSLVEQTQNASSLMPKITGLEGKKSYLVLLQNNLELRPTGGFIGSYAKLDFENGRLMNIKVDDIYSLDGGLQDVIAPPLDLKNDLGIDRLYLRDSNYEPDFPTSARQASFFYRKEAPGEVVHGVIALDLTASGNLLDAVGGLDLPEYGESVNGANLFERAISHAETGFFPGSQAKKNYLTSLQTQMFNKIFYLSKQNWPAIIQAISKSLEEKHMLVYLEDPSLFSYLASSNWSGVFPRQAEKREGESNDFLAVIESNMGANKSNYYLQRKYDLQSSFTKEGRIAHQLKITYKNTSPSEIFPAGKYKNRLKLYTPSGTTLTKAMLGETDITSTFAPFSDYGRSGFSSLIEILPQEQKQLTINYELSEPLNFKGNEAIYKLEIFKQAGTMSDPLDLILNYPINFKIAEKPEAGTSGIQEIKIQTNLQKDRVLQFKVTK